MCQSCAYMRDASSLNSYYRLGARELALLQRNSRLPSRSFEFTNDLVPRFLGKLK